MPRAPPSLRGKPQKTNKNPQKPHYRRKNHVYSQLNYRRYHRLPHYLRASSRNRYGRPEEQEAAHKGVMTYKNHHEKEVDSL